MPTLNERLAAVVTAMGVDVKALLTALAAPWTVLGFADNTADPAVPVAGMRLYAKTRAGRRLMHAIGPSGVGYALQPALFGNRVALWYPGSGSALGSQGMTPTTAATLSHPVPAATTLAESLYRTRFGTSATAGNASGVRDGVNTIWRGNSAGRGGFFLHHRICSGSIALAGQQLVSGLSSSTALLAGEPSALADVLALVKDSTDTNWQFARRTGTGVVVKADLGVAVAANQTLDLLLWAAPGSSSINAAVRQHNFNGTATTLLDVSYNTSIPASTTFLSRRHEARNGAVAAAANIDLVRSYLESDY